MDIEPLDARLWFEALERLERRLTAEPDSALERQLRHAFHLQQLAPRPLRSLVRPSCGEDQYEDKLERGDLAGAAEALVGPPLSHSARRLGERDVEVQLFLPGNPVPVSCAGESLPTTLLRAWLRSLRTLKARVRAPAAEGRGSEMAAVPPVRSVRSHARLGH